MKKDNSTEYLMSAEFDQYLMSAEFWARWNALHEKLNFSQMTVEEAADYVGLPLDYFRHLYAYHEVLRAQGLTFADVEREWDRLAKLRAH